MKILVYEWIDNDYVTTFQGSNFHESLRERTDEMLSVNILKVKFSQMAISIGNRMDLRAIKE